MRIAYITQVELPGTDAVSEQLVNNLSALKKRYPDWEITIFSPGPRNPPTTSVKEHYGTSEDLSIHYVDYPRFIGRKGVEFLHSLISARKAQMQEYDLVYTRHPNALFWSLVFCNWTMFETYQIKINRRLKYSAWRQFCYSRPRLLGIIAHSILCRDSFTDAGVSPLKTMVAYNAGGSNSHRVSPSARTIAISPDKPVVCYSGRICRKSKGSDLLLIAARQCPQATFLIVGGGKNEGEDRYFSEQIVQMNLTNIVRTGWVAPSEVPSLIRRADILIIPPTASGLYGKGNTVLPLKTFAYLAAGKAIIAPDLPDLREILKHGHNAYLVEPDNPDALVGAVRNLLDDSQLRATISNGAAQDSKKYSWDSRASKIGSFIEHHLRQQQVVAEHF